MADESLLDCRLCDLPLSVDASPLTELLEQLYGELAARGIRCRPHAWLSNEWFTPDEVPGIAIPFYLAHPRLRELERAQMLEVEGGTHDWCMRILRHEAGHVFDNAYRLHRRAGYRELFGDYRAPYPERYRPRPYSRAFVIHLDLWYAQSHPAEDFAETFAVWLDPQSRWRQQYETWPALRKLEYVNDLVQQTADAPPLLRSRRRHRPLSQLKMTLREHYASKRAYYFRAHPRVCERDLFRAFCVEQVPRRRDAAAFLQRARTEVRTMVCRWTGESPLTIDRAIADIINRVERLGLRLRKSPAETRLDVMMMLAVQTSNFLNDGRHRVVL